MTTRQEILLRLACAALWDIANVIPDVEFGADTPPEEDTKLTINKKKFY